MKLLIQLLVIAIGIVTLSDIALLFTSTYPMLHRITMVAEDVVALLGWIFVMYYMRKQKQI